MKTPCRAALRAILVSATALGLCLATARAATNQPRIFCDTPVYDFGRIGSTSGIDHAFILKNAGDVPLGIANVRACCGSTASLDTNRIPPGGEGRLAVRAATRGHIGTLKKVFYVRSNDPQEPYYQFRVEGTVTNIDLPQSSPVPVAVHASPADVDFGRIRDDAAAQRTVTIEAFPTALRITNMFCSSPWFRAEMRPGARDWTVG